MPSQYIPPFFLRNSHLQTIFPTLFRRINGIVYQRERIETEDGDYLNLDWIKGNNKSLCLMLHGLEGHSTRAYMLGMARLFSKTGTDVVCMNFRGCGGESNLKPHFYHSGLSIDLRKTLQNIFTNKIYDKIFLIGFSVGGNILFKYLGEEGKNVSPNIVGAMGFSVPLDLESCSIELAKKRNIVYMKRFLNDFHKKLKIKKEIFPEIISIENYDQIKNFHDYDNRYTAPFFGYSSAQEYWKKNSSIHFLNSIQVPTLLISSTDDPFLGDNCYPEKNSIKNPYFMFELTKYGGHVGFVEFNSQGKYWSEKKAFQFYQDINGDKFG